MYHLEVFFSDSQRPRLRKSIDSASAVLSAIPEMLKEHTGCERIDIYLRATRLFSVDCHGNRVEPGAGL